MTCNSSKLRISKDEVDAAIEWAQNHIVCKEAFKQRPQLMNIRMFDRFTNSNAESEHHSLKKKSLGVKANGSLHQLFKLTDMDSRRRHNIKTQNEHSKLTSTDVKSLCQLSSYVTRTCFQELQNRVILAKQCISKQLNKDNWLVIYQRNDPFDANEVNSFLPYIKRIREVTRTTNGHLLCSCKCYERYGYPCHHLLHVLKCYNTQDVKREWIHIRWTNVYTRYHFSRDSSATQRKFYERLYDNFPVGPMYRSDSSSLVFPIYDGYSNHKIAKDSFDVPRFQIMSRSSLSKSWVYANNDDDDTLKSLLAHRNDSLYSGSLFASQQSIEFSQSIEEQNTYDHEFALHNDDDDSNRSEVDTTQQSLAENDFFPEPLNYASQHVIFKRAIDLCGNNVKAHRELYSRMIEFVHSMEINNTDNAAVIKKRNNDHLENSKSTSQGVTIVSSNKVVNTYNRSTKRAKHNYER